MKTAIDSLKKTVKKYRHAWVLLYGFIYFPWFTYLERHNAGEYFFIHSPLDDYIPFVEYFIVHIYYGSDSLQRLLCIFYSQIRKASIN